jgi:hypothetical protein
LPGRFSLQRRALTRFSSHHKRWLPTHTHLLLLVQQWFILLNAITWLMHIVLLRFRRRCWSCLRLTWFTVTDSAFIADLFDWLSVHGVGLGFAGWDHIYVAWLDCLPVVCVYKVDRVDLGLVDTDLLLLVLRYQVVESTLIELVWLWSGWLLDQSTPAGSGLSELVGTVARLLDGFLHKLLLVEGRDTHVGESLYDFINNLRRSLGLGAHSLLGVWRWVVDVHWLESAVLAIVQWYGSYVVVGVLSV